MKVNQINVLGFLAFLAISAFIFTGCDDYTLQSKWRNWDITIDGDDMDWQDAKEYFPKQEVVVAAANDDEFLYLCMIPHNPEIQKQIMMQGLTTWFDGTGEGNKTFGIRYPIGMMGMDPMVMRDMMQNDDESRDRHGDPSDKRKNMMDMQLDKLEVLYSEQGEPTRLMLSELRGIEVKIVEKYNVPTYELKIPLSQMPNYVYSIGTEPGNLLTLLFETPEIDMSRMPKGKGGGRPEGMPDGDFSGGMSGGMSGGRGGGGRGGRSGGNPGGMGSEKAMPKPLELKLGVQLAVEKNPVQ